MRLRDNDLVMREIDGEMVLLDLSGSAYFASNRTGAFLLGLLKTEQQRGFLVAALADEFGITSDRAAADTDFFLAALAKHDLLI
jgi:hypothetical protein